MASERPDNFRKLKAFLQAGNFNAGQAKTFAEAIQAINSGIVNLQSEIITNVDSFVSIFGLREGEQSEIGKFADFLKENIGEINSSKEGVWGATVGLFGNAQRKFLGSNTTAGQEINIKKLLNFIHERGIQFKVPAVPVHQPIHANVVPVDPQQQSASVVGGDVVSGPSANVLTPPLSQQQSDGANGGVNGASGPSTNGLTQPLAQPAAVAAVTVPSQPPSPFIDGNGGLGLTEISESFFSVAKIPGSTINSLRASQDLNPESPPYDEGDVISNPSANSFHFFQRPFPLTATHNRSSGFFPLSPS